MNEWVIDGLDFGFRFVHSKGIKAEGNSEGFPFWFEFRSLNFDALWHSTMCWAGSSGDVTMKSCWKNSLLIQV